MMRENVLILGHDYTTQFVDIFNQYTRIFDKNKFKVTVAYLTGVANDEIRNRTLAEQVLFLDFSKKSIRNFKIKPIKKLVALSKEHQFNIVICHRYKPTYIMLWVAQFYKISRLISVMHELRTMEAFGRQLLVACLRRKNMLFAGVSNAVRDDMRKSLWHVPKNQITTLYNMIDIELIEPQMLSRSAARQALRIGEDEFVFGNLARLVPNKDHVTLLDAFATHKALCSTAKLMIVGEGALENFLKQKACRDVIFTGFLSGGFKYLKAFDCFVLSSIQEAFGRVLLEAMVAKIPIIATRVNGIPEVMGDVGEIVAAKNSQALARALDKIYLMSAEERGQLGQKGYERARHLFSIPKFNEQFWCLPHMQSIKNKSITPES